MTIKLVVTVGSDSHPFDRLVESVDAWLVDTGHTVEAALQYGTSAPPRHPERWSTAHDYLPFSELQEHLARADVIVTQGGPTGISEARRLGIQPIVVPRTPERGEHVDGHQIAFCRHLAGDGDIILAESMRDLHHALDVSVEDPDRLRLDVDAAPGTRDVVERFEQLVCDLRLTRPSRRRR